MEVTGNFLLDLLFPRHAVDYICEQDRAMFDARLIREIYGFVKYKANIKNDWSSPLLLTASSRASSLRMPNILILNCCDQNSVMQNRYRELQNTQDRDTQDRDIEDSDTKDRDAEDRDTEDINFKDKATEGRETQNGDTQGDGTQDKDTKDRDTKDMSTKDRDTQDKDTTDRDTKDMSTKDRDTQDKDTTDRDTKDMSTKDRDLQNKDTTYRDTKDMSTKDRDTQDKDTTDRDTKNMGTKDRDLQDKDTKDRDTKDMGTKDRDLQDKDTKDRGAHGRNFKDKDTGDRETHNNDTKDRDTKDKDSKDRDTKGRDTQDRDNQQRETHSSDLDIMVMYKDVYTGNVNGDALLNFIKDEKDTGYGKIQPSANTLELDVFSNLSANHGNNTQKYLDGTKLVHHLIKSYIISRESKTLQQSQKTGPARERLNVSDAKQSTYTKKADIVFTVISSEDVFLEQRQKVIEKSCLCAKFKEELLAMPISFVHVAHKSCTEPEISWRVSFSMHEIIIGQALTLCQRQVYLTIKYIVTYFVHSMPIPESISDKKLSSYMIMNAFFAFCDENPEKDWSTHKIESVLQFFRHFRNCLLQKHLPQYLLPSNNLLREVTSEWSAYYSKLFHFDNEGDLIKLLLDIQFTWRLVQFDIGIKTHWAGEDLTWLDAKRVLKAITIEAVVKLEPVRAAQAFWNHYGIYFAILKDNIGDDARQITSLLMEFADDIFKKVTKLLFSKTLASKCLSFVTILGSMVPKRIDDTLAARIQQQLEKIMKQYCTKMKSIFPNTYFIVKYENHGEMDDCVIEYNDDNIVVTFTDATKGKYAFPYSLPSLLFSEPLLYFIVCQQAMHHEQFEDVESVINNFPDNVPKDLQHHPLVLILDIFKKLHFKNDVIKFPDFDEYKFC